MHDVLILSLVEGGACGGRHSGADEGCEACQSPQRNSCGQRVPVLHCGDALRATGASVSAVTAGSDSEIDEVLALLDGPPRPDGLTWPSASGKTRLIVAVSSDAELRHVLRRLVRRYSPPGSRRPAELADGRTIPDLPPIGILPLASGGLPSQLELPSSPAVVAAAVMGDSVRRLDLLRHDGGSVTLDGVLLGEVGANDTPVAWKGRVEVDDVVLSSGDDPIVALSIANGSGTATLDGLPLITSVDPGDGLIDVAIAVPVLHKPAFGKQRLRYEVRRTRGRAVAVTPHGDELPFLDDSVPGVLTRKRSWWIEPGAWSVYTAPGRIHE